MWKKVTQFLFLHLNYLFFETAFVVTHYPRTKDNKKKGRRKRGRGEIAYLQTD